jgi:hypothetical protein
MSRARDWRHAGLVGGPAPAAQEPIDQGAVDSSVLWHGHLAHLARIRCAVHRRIVDEPVMATLSSAICKTSALRFWQAVRSRVIQKILGSPFNSAA